MNVAVLFIILALLLIVLLLVSLQRIAAADRAAMQSLENDEFAATLNSEIPQRDVTDRIFGSEDWSFVTRQGSDRLTQVFLQQRKELAVCWVHTIRVDVGRRMHLHTIAARTSSQLEPLVELSLATHYWAFLIFCQLVILTIRLRGPVAMKGSVGRICNLSKRLSEITESFLRTDPAKNENGRHMLQS
ncbi:MAG: hypothetical protein WBR26_12005 [Candidatus Acidiferrum sp.]